jgi:thiol-disulfide isomerase/thioredoxin
MKRWTFALPLAALALFAIVVAACNGRSAVAGTMDSSRSNLPLSSVLAAKDWIGDRPDAASVAGKVVVLDVFTVDCYNCQNVVPTLRTLYAADRARGLVVIGIHSPETPPEFGRPYVAASMQHQGIVWPVAIDNGFNLWKSYDVSAWPTELFFDRHGRLRATITGDSQDAAVKSTVEGLLAERG